MSQLDEISRAIGELSAKMSGVENAMTRIDNKLDDVAVRVVRTEAKSTEHEERIEKTESINRRVERYEQRAVGGVALITLAAGSAGAIVLTKFRAWLGL